MMTTNSNSEMLAANLAAAKPGATFTGLIITKEGEVRGRGADKKVYGNDTVHVTVITGFSYTSLVQRSLEQMADVSDTDIRAYAAKKGVILMAEDIATARAELKASFEASLKGENVSTTDEVYEPLVQDGETVKSARVYKCTGEPTCKCRTCTGNEKQPVTGTIYLQGIKVYETVLKAAPNGPVPAPKSAPKTVAKNAIRNRLPISKYVSYRLEPGADFILRVGGTAVAAASAAGMDFAKVGELIAKCA